LTEESKIRRYKEKGNAEDVAARRQVSEELAIWYEHQRRADPGFSQREASKLFGKQSDAYFNNLLHSPPTYPPVPSELKLWQRATGKSVAEWLKCWGYDLASVPEIEPATIMRIVNDSELADIMRIKYGIRDPATVAFIADYIRRSQAYEQQQHQVGVE